MQSVTDEAGSLTYMGSFDDQVAKYPWKANIDEQYLFQTLVRHTLFGTPIALNDGYLVNHPVMQKYLMKGTESLLYNLIYHGFIRILANGNSIGDSIERRARTGVAELEKLTKSKRWPVIRAKLDPLSKQQADGKFLLRWPTKDLTQAFLLMVERYCNADPVAVGLSFNQKDTVKGILDKLRKELETQPGQVRTKWENISKRAAFSAFAPENRKKLIHHELMGLANQAYHFGFASCLAADLSSPLGVETLQSPIFDDFFAVGEINQERFEGFAPITLPARPELYTIEKLLPFISQGEEACEQKKKYLAALSRFLSGNSQDGLTDWKPAREEYALFLAKHFSSLAKEEFGEFWLGLWLAVGAGGLATIISPVAGVAVGVLVFAGDHRYTPLLMHRVAVSNLREEFRSSNNSLDQVRQTHWLVSDFLKPDMVKSVTQNVGPHAASGSNLTFGALF